MRISTYTIIARDSLTGEIAIAGGTNWFCYGRWVPHIQAGVGAVGTQAEVNMNYPSLCFANLKAGMSIQEALNKTLDADTDTGGVYQLLAMDNLGNTACHTGDKNIEYAGHISDINFIVAGNTLVDDNTLKAVHEYFMNSSEEFGLKVIKSLQAGHKVGGDIRGMKTAAIKIVGSESTGDYWSDLRVDLRVDENSNPLIELERLYNIACAYKLMGEASDCENIEDSLELYTQALVRDNSNTEIKFEISQIYSKMGKVKEAEELMKEICKINPLWREYKKRVEK
jgi:uncharacterized Ntn-hydrolase superfamily protein